MTRKLVTVAALTLVALVGGSTAVQADNGRHLGQVGTSCAQLYGFATNGEASHAIVRNMGRNEGGLPENIAEFCPWLNV